MRKMIQRMIKFKTGMSGAEALFIAAFLFATTNVLVREMAHMWGDQAQIAARFILVWLLLVGYGYVRKTKASIPKNKQWHVVALSVLFVLAILFFTLSVQKTTIANTLFMAYASTLVTASFLGTIVLKEKLTRRKLIAISLSLLGLAFYSGAILDGNEGIIFGILGGMTAATTNLIAKQLAGVNRSAILRVQFGIGALLALIGTLVFSSHDILRVVSFEGTMTTIVFALILIAGSHLILYGYKHIDVNIGSVVSSSELIFGAVLGFLLFQEVPAVHEIMSGLLIGLGAIIGSGGQKKVTDQDTITLSQA